MLIVGVNAKLTRQVSRNRLADTWWLNLSPVISQLYDAGGYDMLVGTALRHDECTASGEEAGLPAIHITCRIARVIKDGYQNKPTARLWIADGSLRGTLRLRFLPLLQDWPDVIEGFLSVHDASCDDPEASPSLPYLVWKGTR